MLARTPWTPLPEVAMRPKPAPQPKLPKGKRRHLVDAVVQILKRGDPTVFAFEASCRHGIRQQLCLQGWSWALADATAADIVAAALRQIGAKRPTWLEGQQAHFQDGASVPRERCLGCGKPLLVEITERFCSRPCKGAWRARLNERWTSDTEAATADAARMLL